MTTMSNNKRLGSLFFAAAAAALGTACMAQSAAVDDTARGSVEAVADGLVESEVLRAPAELRDLIPPRPDLDTTNTALVFTNPRGQETLVYCVALDADGRALGRARVRVPAQGLRFMLASDLASGVDFIGSAECRSRDRVIPSAFVLGPGLSDATARVNHAWDETRIRFPVIASF